MKTTLFMAMSVNGMIAQENGSEDFLSHDNWQTFTSLVEEFENFIVGRKTYEAVNKWDEGFGFDDFVNAQRIIVSKNPNYRADGGYIVVTSPQEALKKLEKLEFKKALVTGGAGNNTSFLEAGLIDEIILNLEPILLGKGIQLFMPSNIQVVLDSSQTQSLKNGIIQLRYHVKR